MGKPFLKVLKEIAELQAHRMSGAVNMDTQAVDGGDPPPLEFRNKAHLRNLALLHISLINTIMRRITGHTVTQARRQGASSAADAVDLYCNPNPVSSDEFYIE